MAFIGGQGSQLDVIVSPVSPDDKDDDLYNPSGLISTSWCCGSSCGGSAAVDRLLSRRKNITILIAVILQPFFQVAATSSLCVCGSFLEIPS